VKCEFYCPQGYHKETDGCYQNSVRKGITEISEITAYGGITAEYNPDCIDAGDTTTTSVEKEITGGKWTFTAVFQAGTGSNA
jgi:hypothetical protein